MFSAQQQPPVLKGAVLVRPEVRSRYAFMDSCRGETPLGRDVVSHIDGCMSIYIHLLHFITCWCIENCLKNMNKLEHTRQVQRMGEDLLPGRCLDWAGGVRMTTVVVSLFF